MMKGLIGLTAFLVLFSACRPSRNTVYYVQREPGTVVVHPTPQVIVVNETTPPGPMPKKVIEEKEITDKIALEKKEKLDKEKKDRVEKELKDKKDKERLEKEKKDKDLKVLQDKDKKDKEDKERLEKEKKDQELKTKKDH